MSVKGGLASHLKADAAVAAVVGTRVHHYPVPQGVALPYVEFERQDTEHIRHLDGPSGLRRTEFSVTCYSRDSAEVEALAEAVRESLDGWRGAWSGVRVTCVFLEEMDDSASADIDGGEEQIHRIGMDFTVWHVESVPAH